MGCQEQPGWLSKLLSLHSQVPKLHSLKQCSWVCPRTSYSCTNFRTSLCPIAVSGIGNTCSSLHSYSHPYNLQLIPPAKPPSAPEWNDEKMPMVHSPLPPPYQDMPHQGPPPQQQAFGYPAQCAGAGYNQPPAFMNQQHPAQPHTVTVQPTVYVAQAPLNPVKDYMGYSIFTLLCCCLPLGIAALIHSINAREANFSGDRMRAERNSRTAKTLNHVALGIGLLSLTLMIVYIVVIVVQATRYPRYHYGYK
ncbi:proline-rich transmembrane protein 1 isoform X2 [Oryzias melastigma]|uniref:proline-rich transmembrane protein 1 isoform X2 n=1 Tax=Oryzias melastigma TaxID=30732 RepID=UPI00168D2FAC|nr:proline-rich transmembrane protein 1 isoform X2 [Oryzias melastigma]